MAPVKTVSNPLGHPYLYKVKVSQNHTMNCKLFVKAVLSSMKMNVQFNALVHDEIYAICMYNDISSAFIVL